jgi:hypothetical protein
VGLRSVQNSIPATAEYRTIVIQSSQRLIMGHKISEMYVREDHVHQAVVRV